MCRSWPVSSVDPPGANRLESPYSYVFEEELCPEPLEHLIGLFVETPAAGPIFLYKLVNLVMEQDGRVGLAVCGQATIGLEQVGDHPLVGVRVHV